MPIERFSVGIDIVSINRFKKLNYTKRKEFYKKIFLNSEIIYCRKYQNSYEHFAGKFAVKESTKKAINKKISFLDIETFHINSHPQVTLHGKYKQKFKFKVSISHEKDYAVAIVLAEQIS